MDVRPVTEIRRRSPYTKPPPEGTSQLRYVERLQPQYVPESQKRAESSPLEAPALWPDSAESDAASSRSSSPVEEQPVRKSGSQTGPAPKSKPKKKGARKQEDPWSVLAETVWDRTRVDIEKWSNEIASLLTFAGLLSAVITGFGALAYNTLAAAIDPSDAPVLHRYVAALWFAALVCALAAAAVSISANQWLYYLLTPAGLVEFGPRQKLRIWNLRRLAFQRWHLKFVLGIPPVLLQVAVTLFLVALVGLLWSLSLDIVIPTLVLVCFVVLFQLTTLITPAVVVYSPFQSPQAQWIRWIWIRVLYMCALAVHAIVSKPLAAKAQPTEARTNSVVTRLTAGHHPLHIAQKLQKLPARVSTLAHFRRRPKTSHGTKVEFLEQSIYYLGELCKHCDWVMNEKLFLENPTYTADIDSSLFAATFATTVTKDDKSTLKYIRLCLRDLPVDLACANASTLLVACDNARLDNAIRTEAQDELGKWQYDSLDKHVTIMMAHIIVDVTERLINWKHPEHVPSHIVEDELLAMIDELDTHLHFLPHEADKIYRRLLHLLDDRKAGRKIERLARKHILSGIWKHIASFRFKDVEYIKKMLRTIHKEEEDYGIKLELIILALHIHETRHEPDDDMVLILNDFLKNSTSGQFGDAMLAGDSHVLVLFCDLEADVQVANHEDSLVRLNEALRRLLWLVGDVEFRSHDPSTKTMKETRLSGLLRHLNKRLPRPSSEPIGCCDPPTQQPAQECIGQHGEATLSRGRPEKVDDQRRRFLPRFGCIASDIEKQASAHQGSSPATT